MKKVVIFGVGGFVGPYLAKEFIDNEYIVVTSARKASTSVPREVTFEHADILDYEGIKAIIQTHEPDYIVNLAGISSVGGSWSIPQTTVSANVNGALNIMEAVRMCNLDTRILLIGSSEEYAASNSKINEDFPLNAGSPYGISKVMQEQFAELYRKQYEMKIYHVRPFNHTGVGQADSFVLPSFCRQVAEISKSGSGGTMYVGNLSAKRDMSHVRDVVRAYRMVLEQDENETVFNIGCGMSYSIQEILDYIISLSCCNITVEVDPKRFRPVDNPVVCSDNTKIRSVLNWEPKYSVFDAIKEMYNYYLKC